MHRITYPTQTGREWANEVMSVFRIWILFLVTSCTACAVQVSETPARGERKPYSTIYLVNHGWYAGVVLPRARIPEGLWPVSGDFPGTQYLEVGWGDRDYYRTTDPHMGLILKAALLPSASVLHITGFSGSIPAYFRYSEVIEIELSSTALSNLAHTMAHIFARNSAGNTSSLGQDLY